MFGGKALGPNRKNEDGGPGEKAAAVHRMIETRDKTTMEISEKDLIEMAKPLHGLYRHQVGGWRVKNIVKEELAVSAAGS